MRCFYAPETSRHDPQFRLTNGRVQANAERAERAQLLSKTEQTVNAFDEAIYDLRREKIKLESSAGTGHFYTTTKNKTNTPHKLEFKKYDPVVRKHVVYKETKLK